MKSSKVAKRYAKALIEVAERGQVEQWGAELDRLAEIVGSPEIKPRLESPEIGEPQRQEAMAKIAEKLELSFPLRSFAVVVARHGRTAELDAIAQAYRDLADDMFSRTRAALTFASEPSADDIARVVSALEQIARRKVIPTVKIDGELLGGVVAEMGGKIYDGSLATRLADAQRRLAGNP